MRRVTARAGFNLLPFLLVGGALLLYLPRLEVPARYIYDEAYHAFTAGAYRAGLPRIRVPYLVPRLALVREFARFEDGPS